MIVIIQLTKANVCNYCTLLTFYFIFFFKDDNECARTICHEHATCHDTVGSFRCECNEGFTGDGLDCQGKN